MNEPNTEKARALVAIGCLRTGIVIATNSLWIAMECEAISDGTEDLGMLDQHDYDDPGIYLWEGTLRTVTCGPYDSPEVETEYRGKIRPVEAVELAALLKMSPPEEEGLEIDPVMPEAKQL